MAGPVKAKEPPWIAHPMVAALVYAATLFGANFLLELNLSTPARLVIALLPAPAFLLLVWSQVEAYKRADELWQRILLTTWAYALVASMLGALILHYVQRAGFFPHEKYPNLEYWGDVLPYSFLAGCVIGYVRATRRYQ